MKLKFIISITFPLLLSCSPFSRLSKEKQKDAQCLYREKQEFYKVITSQMKLNDNDTICDIASGYGESVSILQEYLPSSTKFFAEDINRKFCNKYFFKYAYKFYHSTSDLNNITFKIGKKDKIPFKNNSFTNVTLFISLHEFDQKEKMLSELYRILRRDGKLYLLETVSINNYSHKDENCGFYYLKDSAFNRLINGSGFAILKDTIPHEVTPTDSTHARFLIMTK